MKKTQNKGYYGAQGHSTSSRSVLSTNRKPVCDFLLVIDSNWHSISYRFGVIALYRFCTLCVFEPPLGRGLRCIVRCSSWAHWKARSKLPISVNWTFFARCIRPSRYERRDRETAISLQCGQFDPNFQVEGIAPPPTNHFARIVRPMNAL